MTYLETVQVTVCTGNRECEVEIRCYRDKTVGNLSNGRTNEFCKSTQRIYNVLCIGSIPMWISEADSGRWLISGPNGIGWEQEVVVVGPPRISGIGPVVVRRQLRRKLIIAFEYSLKHLKIKLQTEVHRVEPRCEPYTRIL